MSTANTMNVTCTPDFNAPISTDQADEAPLPVNETQEERKHDNQPVQADPVVQPPSKDNSEDTQNNINAESHEQTSQISGELEKEAAFYQHLAREVVADDESSVEAISKVHTSIYRSLLPELLEAERKENRLEARSWQAILHISYTDQRVRSLEKEVKKLRRDLEGLPEDFEVPNPVKDHVYLHELKRSTSHEFRLTKESSTIAQHLQPALEALFADRGPGSNETKTGDNSSRQRSPESLRIRPRLLVRHLGGIIPGQDIEIRLNIPLLDGEDRSSAVVFRKPFKMFCTFENQIRTSVKELGAQIEKKANETADSKGKAHQLHTKPKAKEYDDEDLIIDLKLLIEFLDVDLKPTLELRSKIKDGTATTIEYQDLWHLFNLGDHVIRQSSIPEIYRVINTTGGREPLISLTHVDHKPTPVDGFVIDCYNLGFNGSSFGPKLTSFSIRKFQGSRLITSLPVFPLKFESSREALEKDLIDRGTRYLELTRLPYAHRLLVGTTVDELAEEIDAQIIVDMTLAINKNPKWHQDLNFDESDLTQADKRETQATPFCIHTKYNEGCCGSDIIHKDLRLDKSRVDEYIRSNLHALKLFPASDLAEQDKVLLPHWAYGFVLRSRQWVTVNINDLSDVIYENNFDSLVLPSGHKETVRALVRNHARTSTNSTATSNLGASMDLVRGKGKGLIILLHGEPGVGKTSTAECVADLTQRPLFPVTCGDIGETASEVQNSLDHNFQLAHKWGCVLLLDEADVFMAKRNKTDLRRNAVVSVFLRTLEYYSGILFLTTNRVGSIDPAFKSRIHMSLFYPHLSLDATLRLYQILLDRTIAEQKASGKVDFRVKPKEIKSFAKSHFKHLEKKGLPTWNGRQIRNAFQTAITLAEYSSRQSGTESTTLGKAQFQTVAEASKEFDKYMKETLGAIDADLARREETRHDRFGARGSSNTPAVSSDWSKDRHLRPTRRNSKDPESESEVLSDMDDEDDDDDDDEEDILPRVGDATSTTTQGKAAAAGSSKGKSGTGSNQLEMKEFEEFQRFQEMKKRGGKY